MNTNLDFLNIQQETTTQPLVLDGSVLTMASSQLANMLGKDKKHINEAIKKMFQKEIDGRVIRPSLDARNYVDEYHLPEVEANMFVAKHDISHLRKVTEYFVNGKAEPVSTGNLMLDALNENQRQVNANAKRVQMVETNQALMVADMAEVKASIANHKVPDVVPSNMSTTSEIQNDCDNYFPKGALEKIFKHNLPIKMYALECEFHISDAYHWNTTAALMLLARVSELAIPVKEGSDYYSCDELVPMTRFVMKKKANI